jgi:hypothetical protein
VPALVLVLVGCDGRWGGGYAKYPPDTRSQLTIEQGVWGNVWFWEGDFMPVSWGKITPVRRAVYAFELTSSGQVEWVERGVFFRNVGTRLVDSTLSNQTGFFQMALPPGKYSVFVREDSLYYACGSDGQGNIQPATVETDSVTRVQIDIIYKACF